MRNRPLPRAVALAALLALPAGSAACARDDAEVIDRAVFVDTYVDLRLGALAQSDHMLTAADRERILKQHGVTDEDLLHFVDVKGADPDYMVRLWSEIAGRVPIGTPPPSMGIQDSTLFK